MSFNQSQIPARRIGNGTSPKEGPEAASVTFNFQNSLFFSFNFQSQQNLGVMSKLETIYVDASTCPFGLQMVFSQTLQRIYIPPNSQGYYSVLSSTPIEFTIQAQCNNLMNPGLNGDGGVVMVQLMNVFIAPSVWFPENVLVGSADKFIPNFVSDTCFVGDLGAAAGRIVLLTPTTFLPNIYITAVEINLPPDLFCPAGARLVKFAFDFGGITPVWEASCYLPGAAGAGANPAALQLTTPNAFGVKHSQVNGATFGVTKSDAMTCASYAAAGRVVVQYGFSSFGS